LDRIISAAVLTFGFLTGPAMTPGQNRLSGDGRETGMLVLTRCVGESIVIGSDVVVIITGIKGSQVRLGIEAPAAVPVDREEIRDRKLAEQQAAANAPAAPWWPDIGH